MIFELIATDDCNYHTAEEEWKCHLGRNGAMIHLPQHKQTTHLWSTKSVSYQHVHLMRKKISAGPWGFFLRAFDLILSLSIVFQWLNKGGLMVGGFTVRDTDSATFLQIRKFKDRPSSAEKQEPALNDSWARISLVRKLRGTGHFYAVCFSHINIFKKLFMILYPKKFK